MKEYAGSLIFDTKINNSGFSSGIKDIMGTLTKLGAAIGLVLGFKGAIKEAEKYKNAIRGLTSIMEGQGRSTQRATSFIQEYTKDGLIPQTQAITAYKNLALRGYDTSQIEKVMNALKDSATYGRQASYSLGEAVQTATEGLKNENSILVDNAGVTKNVAKMWDEYAKAHGTTAANLTQSQKIQAEVAGILEETKFQLGDAAGYADTYSGRMARLNAQFIEFKQNMGASFMAIVSALAPALNWLMNQLLMLANVFRAVVEVFMGVSLKQDKNTSSTKKATKAMDAYGKSVKNAAKASSGLASFDKLNTLSSNKGSASNGVSTPDIKGADLDTKGMFPDLSKINKDFEKMKNVIKEIKPLIAGLVAGIATFVVVGKVQKLFEAFSKGESIFNKTRIGVALFVAGIVTLVMSIKELVMNWDNLSAKQKIIKAGMAVLGAAAIALGYAIAAGISAATLGIGAVIAAVVALATAVVSFAAKLATEKDAIKDTKDALKDLEDAKKEYAEANNEYVNAVDKSQEAFKNLEEAQQRTGISGADLFAKVQNGTLDYANMTEAQKEVYKAYLENEEAQNKLQTATDTLTKAKRKETDASWANKLAIAAESDNYDEYKKSVVEAYEKGEISAEQAREYIEKSMSRMSDASQKTFMEDLPSDIKNGLDPDRYQTTGQKIKNWFGSLWSDIKSGAKSMWNNIFGADGAIVKFWDGLKNGFKELMNELRVGINSIISKTLSPVNKVFNKIKGIEILGKSPFGWIKTIPVPQIPKLARGAVIPPRAEFMAILGDQKNGRNLEAPEGLIRKIVREENGAKGELVVNITNPIYIDSDKVAVQTIRKIVKLQELEGGML